MAEINNTVVWVTPRERNPQHVGWFLCSCELQVIIAYFDGECWKNSDCETIQINAWADSDLLQPLFRVTYCDNENAHGVAKDGSIYSSPRKLVKPTGNYNSLLAEALNPETSKCAKDAIVAKILVSKDAPSKGLNRMGCSENWHDSYYVIAHTFEEGEIKNMTKHELDLLIKLADKMSEAFY